MIEQMAGPGGECAAVLRSAYRLFNHRRIDGLLALLTDDVEWPDVAGGTVLRGKDAVRSYWEAQFVVVNSQVNPIEFRQVGEDLIAVVDQRVLDRQGRLLADAVVFHRYTFTGGLVSRMVVCTGLDGAPAVG